MCALNRSLKVLLTEDSPVLATRLKEIVSEMPGFELVGCAGDVNESIRLARVLEPDALLLDLQITGGTGLDVLCAVRAMGRDVAIVVLTNSATSFVKKACLEAGADFFLDKSAELAKLPAILSVIAGRASSAGSIPTIDRRGPLRRKPSRAL